MVGIPFLFPHLISFDSFQPRSSLRIFCDRDGWEHLPDGGQPKLPPALPEEEGEGRPDPRVLPISYEACASQEGTNELSG